MNNQTFKNIKINLNDYNHQENVSDRIFLANLSFSESSILQEIIDNSLTIPVNHIAENLDLELSDLLPALQKLSTSNLYTLEADTIHVSKEKRKYFESEAVKFDSKFQPDMNYLQKILSKVPIEVLPTWYSLPRHTENIFDSILEKYLLTPKTFHNHLLDLQLPTTLLHDIVDAVYHAPELKISGESIKEKFELSDHEFQECMLLLEYHLVCCLKYERDGDGWAEWITPFNEWHTYLTDKKTRKPQPIQDADSIIRWHSHDFGFITDCTLLLEKITENPLLLEQDDICQFIPYPQANALFPHLGDQEISKEYTTILLSNIQRLKLATVDDNHLIPLPASKEWLSKSIHDLAMTVYRLTTQDINRFTDLDVLELEKSFSDVAHLGWIYFDDFLKSLMIPIGSADPVRLNKQGNRWSYMIPSYTEEDLDLVDFMLQERLFLSGMVTLGRHNGRRCFYITPFGRMSLGS